MESRVVSTRATVSRSVSLLLMVALAVRAGLGLSETIGLLRDPGGPTTFARVFAEAVVRYSARPAKRAEERPAQAESKGTDAVYPGFVAARVPGERVFLAGMLRAELISLPPPRTARV